MATGEPLCRQSRLHGYYRLSYKKAILGCIPLRRIDEKKHPDTAAAAQRVLVTMEGTLAVMRGHLRVEEEK
jgi:hypothetical protein